MASISSLPTSSSHEQLHRSDSQTSTDSIASASSVLRGRIVSGPDGQPSPVATAAAAESSSSSSSFAASYAPNDARGMSPRRSDQACGKLEEQTREAVRQHARRMQLQLLEIAESIELVRADHDKLEKQNLALQDYIGNLTRTMGREPPGAGRKKGGRRA